MPRCSSRTSRRHSVPSAILGVELDELIIASLGSDTTMQPHRAIARGRHGVAALWTGEAMSPREVAQRHLRSRLGGVPRGQRGQPDEHDAGPEPPRRAALTTE